MYITVSAQTLVAISLVLLGIFCIRSRRRRRRMAASDIDEGNHAELQPCPRPRRPPLHPIASVQAATSSTGGKISGKRKEASIRLPETFPLSKEIDKVQSIPPTPPFSPPIAKTAVQRRTTYQGHNSDLGSDNDNRAESENNELPRPSSSSVVHTVRIPTHRLFIN